MRSALSSLIAGGMLLAAGGMCFAQVVPYTGDVESVPPEEEFGVRPADATPPSRDPRDLNGAWQQIEEHGPERAFDTDIVQRCAPRIAIGAHAYPKFIVQTPGRITLIAEANHVVRRIYLDEAFPAGIEPSWSGYSVGHWEKDTLVAVTRGIRGTYVAGDPRFLSVTEIVERFRKRRDGSVKIEAVVSGKDKRGRDISTRRSATLRWRPDLRLMEYICEEGVP